VILRFETSTVRVIAAKLSKDGRVIGLRCVELDGQSGSGHLGGDLLATPFSTTFRPAEIKTVRIPMSKGQTVRETSLLEN